MFLTIKGVDVLIENFSDEDFVEVEKQLRADLSIPKTKNRDAIQNAFALAVGLAPDANPSDLWHHIVYRLYKGMIIDLRGVDDAINSWVRASGDAFETFLCGYYNQLLADTGVRLIPLLSKADRIEALKRLGIYGKVGDSKLDILIVDGCTAGMLPTLALPPLGGIHAKVSLAERVSDDVPCSREMMERNFISILATLDVKSFPLSFTISRERAYINYGELGSSDSPTDKRKYIEEHGSFDLAVSYNLRTNPSGVDTASGRKIYVGNFSGQPDEMYQALVAKSKSMSGKQV